MIVPPSVHNLAPSSGTLTARTGRYEKRLSDLAGLYSDADAYARTLAAGDRVVYAVEEVRPSQRTGDIAFGTTWMEPGRIGAEYFLTRGHIHALPDRPETYRGEAGHGLMVMEAPDGTIETREVTSGATVYVPGFWVHRTVNIGLVPLVMTWCYPADAGQDYGIIARSNGMAVRIVADGTGWQAVPNPDYRPRTAAEIAALHAKVA
jgi:glucose-6-phosphate isomerase, archaeal